ncbi:hypothetical protein Tco_0268259 [Tanacetum coccineum]
MGRRARWQGDCSNLGDNIPEYPDQRHTLGSCYGPVVNTGFLDNKVHWFFLSRVRKNCKPCFKDAPTSLNKWKDKFFLVDRRAAPIVMPWRYHDSRLVDLFPRSGEFSESDAESCYHGGVFASSWFSRLQDVPPKTEDMDVAEMPCRKVLSEKEKKRVNNEHGDESIVDEGQGDNVGGWLCVLLVLTRAFLRRTGRHPGSLEKAACKKGIIEQLKVIFWKNLFEEHANLVYAHESCKEMKACYKECKKEMDNLRSAYDENGLEDVNAKQMDRIKQLEDKLKKTEEGTHQLRIDRKKLVVLCGNGEIVRQRIIKEYLPTFVRWLHQSAEYKQNLGEVFSLAVEKVFIDGISIGRKEEDV